MVITDATAEVDSTAAAHWHSSPLNSQRPWRRLTTQKGMLRAAVQMSVQARLWMNTFVMFWSRRSVFTATTTRRFPAIETRHMKIAKHTSNTISTSVRPRGSVSPESLPLSGLAVMSCFARLTVNANGRSCTW